MAPTDLMYGMASPAFAKIGGPCGFEPVLRSVVAALRARFPELADETATALANYFLGQMVFWSSLSE